MSSTTARILSAICILAALYVIFNGVPFIWAIPYVRTLDTMTLGVIGFLVSIGLVLAAVILNIKAKQ